MKNEVKAEDAYHLNRLADWFDKEDKTGRWPTGSGNEIQQDLRRIANVLDELYRNAN